MPHELYLELFRNPPEGYEYITQDMLNPKKISVQKIGALKRFKILTWLNKKVLRRFISPHEMIQKLSQLKEAPEEAEIVHAENCLYFGKKPWIVDMESVNALTGHNKYMLRKNKKLIEETFAKPNCKAIITFTNFAKKTIEANLDTSKFKDKIEVIHYSTKTYTEKEKRKDNKIRFLFVGSVSNSTPVNFYMKGGKEVIDVFEILNKKYRNLELILVTCIPREIEERIKKIKNIKMHNMISRKELSKIFHQCDIFLYPTLIAPGLASIEALATGLVTLGLDLPENDEVIENRKNGFLIKPVYYEFSEHNFIQISEFWEFTKRTWGKNGPKVVEGLVEKAELLIKNPKIRKKMGEEAKIKYQKEFSLDIKRKRLKEIFDGILTR